MNQIIFWGATGQSIVLEEILKQYGYHLSAVIDNNPAVTSPFPGIPVIHGREVFEKWFKEQEGQFYFAIAIGGDKGDARIAIGKYLEEKGLTAAQLIHATAYVSPSAQMGKGAQVLAQAAVCARVKLGDYTIINTSASVDHEGIIGNGVHIGPGAKIAGCVEIGDNSFIGTGAVILPRIKIGANTTIGAGSVVTRNIPGNVICYGSPAKVKSAR